MLFPKGRVSTLITLVVICSLAFVVKFAYLGERKALPDFAFPTLDAKYNDEWAWGLASGDWQARSEEIKHQPFFRAPLYPYLLSLIFRVFGHDYFAVRVTQIAIGSISAALFFLLLRVLLGSGAAWIGIFLYLGYWPITYFEGELLIPVMIVFLDILFLLSLIGAARKRQRLWWMLSGLSLGLSAIARPNILIVVLPVMFWIKRSVSNEQSPRFLHVLTVFVLGSSLAVLPVTLRNLMVGRDLVLIASQGGVNFYIGNNPESNGVRAVVPGTRADWWGGYDDTRRIASEAAGHDLKPSQVSRYWFKKGFHFIISDPGKALRLYLRKLVLVLGNGEISNNRQLYFVRGRSKILQLLFVNFALILALASVGICNLGLSKRNREKSQSHSYHELLLPLYFIIPYMISILLFFVTSRYRLPVSILLIIYSSYGVQILINKIRLGQKKQMARDAAIFLVVFGAASTNPFGVGGKALGRGYYDLGVDYMNSNYIRAIESFTKSILNDSTYAPAWNMRGWAYSKIGLYDKALEDLQTACTLDSTSSQGYLRLGIVRQKLGQREEALRVYTRALRLDKNNKIALTNMADIYMQRKEFNRARALLKRALKIDPDFVNAVFGMGSYYEAVNDFERAEMEYGKISHLPEARIKIIHLCFKEGNFQKAEELVKQWEEKYKGAPDIRFLKEQLRKKKPK